VKRNENIKASEELAKRVSIARRNFRKMKIYFSKNISEEVNRLLDLLGLIAKFFETVTSRNPYNFEQIADPEVIETWKKAVIVINELFPVLEESFRKHLGVNELEKS
jgi:hypothetical protein